LKIENRKLPIAEPGARGCLADGAGPSGPNPFLSASSGPLWSKRSRRLVLHVDVDAFFASVEQLLVPALRGRPVIVGSGCIASCSYEARRAGLRAGMSLREAARRCPQAVVMPGDQQVYRCFAEQVWAVCRRYVTELETYLDEAYGDATGMEALHGGAMSLGRRLREDVLREVRLPVSVGLASNRMLAKIASGMAKPKLGTHPSFRGPSSNRQPLKDGENWGASLVSDSGVVWVPPGREEAFLADLPAEAVPGVGHRTAEALADMNVHTVRQLRRLSRASLGAMFGLRGEAIYERCRGRDSQPLRPGAAPRTISRETTFHAPTHDPAAIRGMVHYLLERAMRTVRRLNLLAGRVELSIRYDDWKDLTASRTLGEPTADDDAALDAALGLLDRLHRRRVALRHVGVVLGRLVSAGTKAALFEPPKAVRSRRLYRAIDSIRDRWGHASIVTGRSIELLGRLEQNDYGFVLRTPCLTK